MVLSRNISINTELWNSCFKESNNMAVEKISVTTYFYEKIILEDINVVITWNKKHSPK